MNSPQHRAWQPRMLRKPEVLHDHLLYKVVRDVIVYASCDEWAITGVAAKDAILIATGPPTL
eukprot:5039261-Pyramimonas_sp.AAC.1